MQSLELQPTLLPDASPSGQPAAPAQAGVVEAPSAGAPGPAVPPRPAATDAPSLPLEPRDPRGQRSLRFDDGGPASPSPTRRKRVTGSPEGVPSYDPTVSQSAGSSRHLPPPPPTSAGSPPVPNHSVSFGMGQPLSPAPPPTAATPSRSRSQQWPTGSPPGTPGCRSDKGGARTPASTPGGGRSTRSLAGNSRSEPRIDPEQAPRPVTHYDAVKDEGGKVYETSRYHVPPSPNVVCTIVDRGSSSCEFMRCSLNQVPAYPSGANTAKVPMVVVCQPFAELTKFEEPIPVIDFGESGPLRCTRCKAYVNPHFAWMNSGRTGLCNFCGQQMEVPSEYKCYIEDRGRRRGDATQRPELARGTVDYVAPRDYDESLPGAPCMVFVIETTAQSLQSGLLAQVAWTLRSLLGFLQGPCRVAFITFDESVNFYAFYPNLDSARVVTVVDVDDPFCPCGPDALCIPADDEAYSSQVDAFLEELPNEVASRLDAGTLPDQAAGCAALKSACELAGMSGGGHVICFHASLPVLGVGALRPRDDLSMRVSSAPEAGGLFTVQQGPFFDALAADCLGRGVAVSVFLAPAVGAYIDAASLTCLPRRTGGEISMLAGFDPVRDGERLHYDISRIAVQACAYSCVFRLRCSKGLAVDSMLATWEPEVIDPSTFHVSRMSVDATASFVIVHSERIEGQKTVFLQVACLHTTRAGRRLLRVHTLALPVTTSLSNVFRYTEIDCVTNLLLKQAALGALSGNGAFKEKMSKSCVDMLHAYRVNCASMTSAGQLVLPESLKLLPLFVGSIRKLAAFRSGSDIRVDERLTFLVRMLGLPLSQTSLLVYPRVYQLLPLPERAGLRTGVADNVYLPPPIACSSDKLSSDRIYLIDNGQRLYIYVRPEVSLENLQDVFNVDNVAHVPAAFVAEELSEDVHRMLAIVQQIRKERNRLPWLTLSFVLPGSPEEPRLLSMFCEDRVSSEPCYIDFLCEMHRKVQSKQD